MAKQRLFPEPQAENQPGTRHNFDTLAAKIFAVPKTEIDAREKQWRRAKKIKAKQ